MLPLRLKFVSAGILGTLALAVSLTEAPAQPVPVAVQPAADADDGAEVLARGPVHEAFASTVEIPKAGEIAPKMPPEPIEELPPDQKPEGDNVQWIPGYWDWDDERTDFIWVSGFWRVPPPNHVWVPGSWNKIADGWQWTSGFWQLTQPNQVQPELEYLPPPPQPLETGPSIPAPDDASIYVTGSWVYRGRYVWRPGYWIANRPGWLWVPAHYRWTPLGFVFINGYWDYPLAGRGVLFAPVYYPRRNFAAGYFYTPRYVVSAPVLFSSLFIRRGYSSYYFGDYYTANYGRIGYQPWCAPALRGVAVVPARGWHYDPLWNYYSVNNRRTPNWSVNIAGVYAGRYDGTLARPPRTLAQQNQVIQRAANINNVSNVTNTITVVNNNFTVNNKDVSSHVMVAPLAVAPKIQAETKLQPISQQVRQAEAKHAAEIRQVAVNRQRAEAEALKARPATPVPAPGMPPAATPPVKVKINVPQTAVQRARVVDEKRQPPPAPVLPKFDPKVEPPKAPVVPPKNVDPPKPPVTPPKVDPKPKVDPPKPPVTPPKVDPKPKVDPPKPPVTPPKVDPKPKVDPPTPPKVDPKPKVDPPKPPVVPPKVDPKPKVDPPKVDPPRPPVIPPKADPPKPPVIPPKVDPPKPPPVQPRPPVTPPPKADPPKSPPKIELPKAPVQPRIDPPRAPVVQPRAPVVQPRAPVVQPRVEPPRVQIPARPAVPPRAVPSSNPPARPVVQPRVIPPRNPPAARPAVNLPRNPPAARPAAPPRGNGPRNRR